MKVYLDKTKQSIPKQKYSVSISVSLTNYFSINQLHNMNTMMEITMVKNGVIDQAVIEDQTIIEDSIENASCLEEEETFFQDLEALLDHNIAASDIQKLKKAGINTVKGVQMTMRKKLMQIEGFTEEKINAIKEACCKISLTSGFLTAFEVSDQRKQVFKLSTGSSNLE